MCSICRIIHAASNRHCDHVEFVGKRDIVTHGGPGDAGLFTRGQAGIAPKSLSVVDLEGVFQPFTNEDNAVWITFNGEIYNQKNIHDELLVKEHRTKSKNHTEKFWQLINLELCCKYFRDQIFSKNQVITT